MSNRKPKRGLLLSGGGARAAYQAGVLRHICEISSEDGGRIPFEILVGASAGAINLAALASNATSFAEAMRITCARWNDIATHEVFDARATHIGANAFRWFLDLALGGAVETAEPRAKSLVDTSPLRKLIEGFMKLDAIEAHIANGVIEAVAVSATDYQSGALTIFVQSQGQRTLWRRYSRFARYDKITADHILASCAIPILFPAVKIGNAYYGDGSIRNTAPLSPAIHLGARKVLAIGVREMLTRPVEPVPETTLAQYPSPARISGVLLDSIFLDALEMDREQMMRVNRLLESIPDAVSDDRGVRMQPIDFLYIGPSKNLAEIAGRHRDEIPRSIRYMLKGLGANAANGGNFLSYLLFEKGYCRELLELGYADAKSRSDEIRDFLWTPS